MTNYEKCKDKIKKYMPKRNYACLLFRIRNNEDLDSIEIGSCSTQDCSCSDCVIKSLEWLNAEYIEPEVDWRKVVQGTMIYSNVLGEERESGKFVSAYKDQIVIETECHKYRSYNRSYCRLEK